VAYIHGKGASFIVDDPKREAHRVSDFEISPSGPIFGSKMLEARGNPGLLEKEILKEIGLELEEIRGRFGIRIKGARRPLRVPLEEHAVRERPGGLELSFFLPTGSYATVVLREVTKCLDAEIR
jgi:tRNA pseudouridine13 synthase